jgi:hypothetical protein
MAVSRADLDRLRELHVDYFQKMQALVADSTPSECVVLFNTELFALRFARREARSRSQKNLLHPSSLGCMEQ